MRQASLQFRFRASSIQGGESSAMTGAKRHETPRLPTHHREPAPGPYSDPIKEWNEWVSLAKRLANRQRRLAMDNSTRYGGIFVSGVGFVESPIL